MTIDILVHPEHGSWDYGAGDEDAYQTYLQSLSRYTQGKDFVIIRSSQEIRAFSILPEKTFFSVSLIAQNPRGYVNLGDVHPDEWERFTNFANTIREQEIRIHGCNFGECTLGFSRQLLGFLNYGRHLGQYRSREDLKDDEKALQELEERGEFLKSKIRYGIVLAPPLFLIDSKIIGPCEKYPHGNANYQLTDNKTELHRSIA